MMRIYSYLLIQVLICFNARHITFPCLSYPSLWVVCRLLSYCAKLFGLYISSVPLVFWCTRCIVRSRFTIWLFHYSIFHYCCYLRHVTSGNICGWLPHGVKLIVLSKGWSQALSVLKLFLHGPLMNFLFVECSCVLYSIVLFSLY